jgi:alpha-tubulin suppressor-like RCC1 family protein
MEVEVKEEIKEDCSKNQVVAFGGGMKFTLGQGNGENLAIPTVIKGLKKIVSVASGTLMGCAISSEGKLYVWGTNKKGCLGLGHGND